MIGFHDTKSVFINPVPKGPAGFLYILLVALFTLDYVNQVG